jgi:hypothetical protein
VEKVLGWTVIVRHLPKDEKRPQRVDRAERGVHLSGDKSPDGEAFGSLMRFSECFFPRTSVNKGTSIVDLFQIQRRLLMIIKGMACRNSLATRW